MKTLGKETLSESPVREQGKHCKEIDILKTEKEAATCRYPKDKKRIAAIEDNFQESRAQSLRSFG